MKYYEIKHIVNQIDYKPNWHFDLVLEKAGGRPYLQAHFVPDNPVEESWKSAKVYLSYHMCRQEIVGSVFKMIRDAEEHEMREAFRYRGVSIYNCHLDPDWLSDQIMDVRNSRQHINVRENAMSMEE
jgi:hypothetical protein